jgi:rhodanese-related sulfurtransferase
MRVVAATISREDLKAKLDQGDNFILVETLSEEQYQHTHLPTAVNLPPDRVRELAPEILPDKEADIVVYCGSPR